MIPRAFTPLDGVVAAVLLALCWALWGMGEGPDGAGGPAAEVISPAGTERHPLTTEQELRVAGPLGESVVHLGPAGVRFLSSPCPLQLCVRGGWVTRPGAVAACLPNRVAVRVLGGARGEGVDAVGR
ncbi:MAG: NusG domain II-containing protein [Deferrisomatales bacterium]|nr:NusG domain II-containing protein [Deferrisomatales bacterium]